MSLLKLKLSPGINRDATEYANTGGWYDCDKIRFRNGNPEKIGGWQKDNPVAFVGNATDINEWSSLLGSVFTSIGTSKKFYLYGGNFPTLTNVTPIRDTVSLTNPFTTSASSLIVTVTDADHGADAGSYVTFTSVASDVGGVTAARLTQEFEIVSVIDLNQYTIRLTGSASGITAATGGGSVTAVYQINPGLDTFTVGTGWGVGPWGGATSPYLTATLGSNPLALTNGSATMTVTWTSHGLSAGDNVILSGISTSLGSLPSGFFNMPFTIVTVPTANTFTVTLAANFVGTTGSYGGSSVVATSYQDAGLTGWGEAAAAGGASQEMRYWSTANFGENLVANISNGGIYYWQPTFYNEPLRELATYPGVTTTDCPTVATEVLVSDLGQHLMAFGSDVWGGTAGSADRMNVRWSDSENPFNWDEGDTTTNAGSFRLGTGSKIVTVKQTRQEILVWTDTALYSIQYSGVPYIFTPNLLSANVDIIGPKAKAVVNNTAYWMGIDNFYYYDGTVKNLPCTVRDKVFLDLNTFQSGKVACGVNSAFNEIWWFYPSINSEVNDRYVCFNYAENIWYYGSMGRTAWFDHSVDGNPLATGIGTNSGGIDPYIYSQEVGDNDGSGNGSNPMHAYITSSPVEIEDGEHFAFVKRIIPDISLRNTTADKSLTFTIYPQDYPGGMYPGVDGIPTVSTGTGDPGTVNGRTASEFNINLFTQQLFTRIRGRSVILKVESDTTDIAWRLGTPRFEVVRDGRR